MLATLLICGTTLAAPRRPLNTDDAFRGEPGAFEFSLAYYTSESRDSETTDWVELGLTHTVTDQFELSVGTTNGLEQESGFGGIDLEAKFSFFEESGGIPGLATSVGFTPGSADYSLTGIATRTLGPAEISVNLGFDSTGDPSDEATFTYAGSVEYGVIEKLTLVAELDGESLEGESANVLLAGLKFMVLEEVELDISYSTGLDDADPESELAVGFTITN